LKALIPSIWSVSQGYPTEYSFPVPRVRTIAPLA